MSAAQIALLVTSVVLVFSLTGCDVPSDNAFLERAPDRALSANNCRSGSAQTSQKGCKPFEGVSVAAER